MQEELDKIAIAVASAYKKRNPRIAFDDLYQDAWIGILLAKRSHDPKRGAFAPYARRAAVRWVWGRLARMGAIVSCASDSHIRDLFATKTAPCTDEQLGASDNDPEFDAMLAEFRHRVQEACKAALPLDPATLGAVLRILVGLTTPAQETRETGLPIRRLNQATYHARKRLAASRCVRHVWEEWRA